MIKLFIIFMFHHPKKSHNIQGHKVKIMNKIRVCYPISNSFEINLNFLNTFVLFSFIHLLFKFDIWTFTSFSYV
jgi:hypothetical protein